ncbi:DUF488 family protein [Streptomyces griseoincarnatus]
MANRVHTIGNSNRTSDEVLTILQKHEITDLVDVRSFSASRTNPQWNQNAIVDALPSAIRYRGVRELGGRRHTPKDVESVNTAWRVNAFRDY